MSSSRRVMTPEEVVANDFQELVHNVLVSRSELINKFLDPRRDVLIECGHPTTGEITPQHYSFLFERNEIANRVVKLMPSQCWAEHPELYEDEDPEVETPFEMAWKALCRRIRGNSKLKETKGSYGAPVWSICRRADELSGIGQYGVILVGFDDIKDGEGGKSLRDPVEGVEEYFKKDPNETSSKKSSKTKTEKIKPKKPDASKSTPEAEPTDTPEVPIKKEFEPERQVLFLRVFEQTLADITQFETDLKNPRYGMPNEYLLTFNDPNNQPAGGVGLLTQQQHVHWSRIIHISDNLTSSEVFGTSRMRPVYNRLLDLMKLYGGSAEMYWRGAFPGFALETHPQLGGDVVIDSAAIKSQMQDYMNKLQRYIALMGMSAKSLAPQVSDPTAQITLQIEAICIQLAVPKRIFMGSERGELASTQDEGSWTEEVESRQMNHCIPNIVAKIVDLFIAAKALPEPEDGYCCEWPEVETVTEAEKATVAKTKTDAMAAYVGGSVDALMAPKDWLTLILGLSDDEVESVLENAVEHINEANPDLEDVTVPGQHPEPPPPEIPQSPIKMKEGEKLVGADGSPLPGKGPPKKGIPPQFVKNTVEVLDDEEDFFGSGIEPQDALESTGAQSSTNTPPNQSYDAHGNPVVSEVVNFNPNQPRDSRGRFGSGGGGMSSPYSAGRASYEKSLEKSSKLGKVVRAAWNIFNAVPIFAKETAIAAGASPRVANLAFVAAEIGDWAVPGMHAGSALVTMTSTIKKPTAVYIAAKKIFSRLRLKKAAVSNPALLTLHSSHFNDLLNQSLSVSDPETFLLCYVAGIDVGFSQEEALDNTREVYTEVMLIDFNDDEVANYSPNQPRDSHGRFGSGGGGASGGGGGEQGPPQSFKDFATAEEKKELNKLAKKRLDLNSKVKDGTATQAERVEAVIVKKRIAELKDIAEKRSKGIDVKPVEKPVEKPVVETPKPEVKPATTDESWNLKGRPIGSGNIKQVLQHHPELNELQSKVESLSSKSESLTLHGKTVEQFQSEKLNAFNELNTHYLQNRGKENDRHPEGWNDANAEAYLKESKQLEYEYSKASVGAADLHMMKQAQLKKDTVEAHKLLEIAKVNRVRIHGSHVSIGHRNKNGINTGDTPGPRVTKKLEAKAEEAREFLESVTSKKTKLGMEGSVECSLLTTDEGRSYHHGGDTSGKIYLNPKIETATAVHEYAHAMEKQIPGLLDKARSFKEVRIRDAKTHDENLRDKYGRSYESHEVGNKDEFEKTFTERNAIYVGKHYPDATEIMSMGTEILYKDPIGFAKKDPEYFKFIVGSLRGAF